DNIDDFFVWLRAQSVIAVDTETTGLDPYGKTKDRICGLALYAHGAGWYLPVRHGARPGDEIRNTREDDVSNSQNRSLSILHDTMDILNSIVDQGGRLLFWNAKFDLHMMCVDGFSPNHRELIDDYMLAAHLINENEPSFG